MKISPYSIALLLGLAGKKPASLNLVADGIEIMEKPGVRLAAFDSIEELLFKKETFTANLTVRLKDGVSIQAPWLPKTGAKQFHSSFTENFAAFRERQLAAGLAAAGPDFKELADRIKRVTSGLQYLRFSECEALVTAVKPFKHFLAVDPARWPQDIGLRSVLNLINNFCSNTRTARQTNNQIFLRTELEKFREFFDRVEANPLTDAQRLAVVQGEDNTLVIAGAGSGKTSVIVAKAGYLVKSAECQPEQILLLAFSRDAMEEMAKRLKERVGVSVKTATFHSLGLEILSQVEDKKPSLSVGATDQLKMRQLLQDILTALQNDEAFAALTRTFFGSYLIPYRSQFDFRTLGEYWEYLQAHETRSLQGDLVKSMEELEIANFLFINGIKYQYERSYSFDTATRTKRQYKPDFTILEPEIYIEHFALDEKNRTPYFINQTEYLAGVAWKRELHSTNKTILIETFSYQKANGLLLATLEKKLKAASVKFNPLSPVQMFEKLADLGTLDKFTVLLATFLNHFKSNLHTVEGLRARKTECKDPARFEAFLAVFQSVYTEYQRRLSEAGEVDFNDMVAKATRYVESGKYRSPFQYILVDEFQDISIGRARLVKALKHQDPNTRLCCVGDDWQAIYRFAGSDIAIMRHFEQEFGHSVVVQLDRTFRYNNQINDLSSAFVLKNPKQIHKQLTPHTNTKAKCISVHWVNNSVDEILQKVVQGLAEKAQGKAFSVLLLGRYKHEAPNCLKQLAKEFGNLKIEFLTIHRSKGLEADFVIILGLRTGRLGFPSEVSDDPLLDWVLSEPESFPEAEERRLFYVALTRAKSEIHLLADLFSQSAFVKEILSADYKISDGGETVVQQYRCPTCETGIIVSRATKTKSVYHLCSHAPYCEFRPPRCSACNEGVLLRSVNSKSPECRNPRCKERAEICPKCKQGVQMKRTGPFGDFVGCSRFPECEFKARIVSSRINRNS
ncbi:MAG TPA: UvrD-helicase domain-containing protein [Verrucomicrobiae bacterium]|nr:UvrD-helicase domain-containing protein [Verrucomicrobiae bacterium]